MGRKRKKSRATKAAGLARRDAVTSAPPAGAQRVRLRLDLLSYWHVGTGRGDGAALDAVPWLDPLGLPEVPGRTVKGLLRAAVHLGVQAGLDSSLDEELEEYLFGSALGPVAPDRRVRALEETRFRTRPGVLRVESAVLGRDLADRERWRDWARSADGRRALEGLRTVVASTALDEAGVALDKTLRTIEVLAPVTLYADIEVDDPSGTPGREVPWPAVDRAVRLFLRSLGSHRNRGFGRCRAALEVA